MPNADTTLGATVLGHILDVAESRCSITEASILAEQDQTLASILAGILMLHEELEDREARRAEAVRRSMELSTPVLEVGHQVLLVPLIGVVDAARSEQLVERALLAVAAKAARVLVIDITGLAVVDAVVAQHLIRTVNSVKLLGGRTILTGVSPAIAQNLVDLNIDLSEVLTRSTLGAGLETAFALVG